MNQLRLVISDYDNISIGLIDLFDVDFKNLKAGVGILINKNNRDKGYAKEALGILIEYSFKYLNLHQLYCNIIENNKPSINLFKSLGFIEVGLKKDWVYFKGEYKNEYLFCNDDITIIRIAIAIHSCQWFRCSRPHSP